MQSASYPHPPQSIARCGFLLFPAPIVVLTNLHHTKDEGIAVLASNTHCDLDDEKVVHDHPCICLSTGASVASLFALLMQDRVSAQFVSRSPARPLMNTALIQTTLSDVNKQMDGPLNVPIHVTMKVPMGSPLLYRSVYHLNISQEISNRRSPFSLESVGRFGTVVT